MNSIKTKLFAFFAAFMIAFVFFGIILNVLFLKRYYIYKNESIFVNTGKKIIAEYTSNIENIEPYINQIDRIDGISCIIADRGMNEIINSLPDKSNPNKVRLPNEIEQIIFKNFDKLSYGYIYNAVDKPNKEGSILVYVTRLDNDNFIILRKAMKGIDESVAIANQFYFFGGLFIVAVGGLFIYFLAKRIAKPITEMSIVAESISNMDFTKNVKVNTRDEIGSLGRSINKISANLSSSIRELLEDVDRRKLLVRNLSHELKTPIGVIKGYTEGLKFGVSNDREKREKYCSVIVTECDRMDSMIRELLNISMLETGMFNLNIIRLDLCKLVKNVADKFSQIINEKGIKLDIILDANIYVNADKDITERVLTNYLTNAIQHVGKDNTIQIKLQKTSNNIRISVYNTGSHISENDLRHIWDVFYKADKARSRQYGGHGLGLSIVKLIAEAQNGSCGVENVKDGVCFYFDFLSQE